MRLLACAILLVLVSSASAQTTRPDTAPPSDNTASPPSAQTLLNQMLRSTEPDHATTAPAADTGAPDTAAPAQSAPVNGLDAVAPGAANLATLREGSDIIDRVGRLQKTADGLWEEFVFDGDGRSLKDPPVFILPNLKLMLMETKFGDADRDLRFRITGTVTEYRGHNYILLDKVVVVQDKNQEF
jgi:hypothetical protein